MENYFIIHGSFGSPYSNWFSWLHDFIETEGKQVYVPDFPTGVGYQNYENWSKLLKNYLDLGLINENTTIICHSIAPVFISKFLVHNKVVNKTMYFDNLEEIKQYSEEIICFYSDNDPYVKYEAEKDFANKVATEQVLIPKSGHINSESGYDTFEEIVSYL